MILANGGATWSVANESGTDNGLPGATASTFNGSPGLAVRDAAFGADVDAFDHGLEVWIGPALFVSPDTVDVTGQTLTAGPVTMQNLKVTVQYAALPDSPTLRVLVTLENPTAIHIETMVHLLSNLGSDANTVVVGSSSGDLMFVAGDHTVSTADSPTVPGDPVVTHVLDGPTFVGNASGTVLPAVGAFSVSAPVFSDGIDATGIRGDFQVQAVPHSTSTLLFFAQLHADIPSALEAAAAFGADTPSPNRGQPVVQPTPGSALLAGLSASDLGRVLNWNFFNWYELVGGGATWTVSSQGGTLEGGPTGSRCVFTSGLAIEDALLRTDDDAFDNGLVLFVDDAIVVPPIGPEVDSRTLTSGVTRMSDLDVSVQYKAAADSPTLRLLATFANPGPSDVTVVVKLASNFGSDARTGVRASSSGDTILGRDDRWVVTSDDATAPDDAVNVQAFAGPGAPVPPLAVSSTVFECSNVQGVLVEFPLTVPAGQTRRLLFFHSLAETNDAGVAAAAVLDTNPPVGGDLLDDLGPAELFEVVNWNFCASELARCDDGNRCSDDSCTIGVGCAHAPVARAAAFLAIECRTDDLATGVRTAVAAGKLQTALANKLAAARAQEEKAEMLRTAGKNGPARRALAKAIKLLRAFEHILGKKKTREALTDEQRAAFTQLSSDLRADLQTLRAGG